MATTLTDPAPSTRQSAPPPPAATSSLAITGMTCASCAQRVRRILEAVPGVREVSVNLALERADLVFDGEPPEPATLIAAVTAAGYGATLPRPATPLSADLSPEAASVRSAERWTLVHLVVAALLTLPLVLPMLLAPVGIHAHLPPWAELLIAAPVQFWIGGRFYRGALHAIRASTGNMDLLVALGTSAAFIYSVWLWIDLGAAASGHLYVEGSAVVITMVLLGKWLEGRAKRSATAAIRELMSLRPATARLLQDGREQEVRVERVRQGDTVVVRPGERVPVDGVVVSGQSELDEALVTGESLPVAKEPGAFVVGGSINGTGLLRVRTTRVGEDTTLARIARLVEQAQTGRAPIQRLVDQVSAVFVPTVIAIAALTFIGWLLAGGGLELALRASVSVLVIACPCALGLATPTALVAGTGVAAKAGILIRDIEVLERAHGLTRVVFDKTGTLTVGRPEIRALHAAPRRTEHELLQVAAAAQSGSEHPLARAVVAAAEARGIESPGVERFRAIPGQGLEAEVEGRTVHIGRADLVRARGVETSALDEAAAREESSGRTVAWVARDQELLGLLVFADALRPEAAPAVSDLAAIGIGATMLSGDNHAAASDVARAVGIQDVVAPVRPEEKAAAVVAMQRRGEVVAMVGDGVNDAPALAAADVGIAIGTGAEVALATAGITLLRPDPRLVPAAIDIARATRRKIRGNLFWAFVYNLVGLPLAASGLLSPALAGAAMAMSSVSVVGNALLLRRWRPDRRRS